MKSIVLIVDDDPDMVDVCRRYLFDMGYGVLWAGNGLDAIEVLSSHRVDIILLDVKLPDMSGFALAERIGRLYDAGIIFVTAIDDPKDRVRGLTLGLDYLTKPFELEELHIRLSMAEKRGVKRKIPRVIAVPPLEMDHLRSEVKLNGEVVPLSDCEFALLELLADNLGETVPYDRLSNVVWPGEETRLHNIMNYISSIRRKLCAKSDGRVRITGKRGVGYSLVLIELAPDS